VIDAEIDTHKVLDKVCYDLIAMGHPVSVADLKAKLAELHELAREQVYKEVGEL
jgi:hypothetical protein